MSAVRRAASRYYVVAARLFGPCYNICTGSLHTKAGRLGGESPSLPPGLMDGTHAYSSSVCIKRKGLPPPPIRLSLPSIRLSASSALRARVQVRVGASSSPSTSSTTTSTVAIFTGTVGTGTNADGDNTNKASIESPNNPFSDSQSQSQSQSIRNRRTSRRDVLSVGGHLLTCLAAACAVSTYEDYDVTHLKPSRATLRQSYLAAASSITSTGTCRESQRELCFGAFVFAGLRGTVYV